MIHVAYNINDNMRKIIIGFIGLFLILANKLYAYDFQYEGLYYSINADKTTVSVVSGDVNYQGDIVIPSNVRYNNIDYVVTSVSGFSYCYNVKSLSISHTVTSIRAFDFMNCSGLISIVVDNNNPVYDSRNGCNAIIETANNKLILGCQNTIIPNTVKIIGDRAFCGCTGLTEITIPNSVVSIDEYAFTHTHITSITIPSSLTSLNLSAFYLSEYLENIIVENGNSVYDSRDNCNAVIETATNTLYIGCKNSTIPRTVETIGRFAFTQCSYLTSIDIPNNVKKIEECAFQSCSLTSLYIPASVDSIEYGAFQNNDFLSIQVDSNNHKYDSRNNCNAIIESTTNSLILGCKNTILLNSVISIGSRAFHGCKSLTSITIPSSVISIGSGAFSWCRNLTSVIIGESVTTIDSYAFEDCKVLNTITFPNRLTYLGDRSFNNTAWLNNQASGLVYAGNWVYIYKGEMPANTSVIIKSGTLGIANSAFQNCTGLVSITLPNSLSNIGYWSFYGCNGLKDIISEIKEPFEISSSVFSVYSTAKLTVPNGTKQAYQTTNCWNKFENIVESPANTGEWRNVTSDFDKSLAFTKIRVKNTNVSSGVYCCVFFSTMPNDNTTLDTKYNINFNRLTIGDGVVQDDSQGYIYINTCESVGDNWYEYEFQQPVYFSHYQTNAPKDQLKAYITESSPNISTIRTIHIATAGTLPDLISESEKYSIDELTLTGELNGTDFRLLRDMAGCNYLGEETMGKLKVLDLSNAKIVKGGDRYVDANQIPGWGWSTDGYRTNVEQDNVFPKYVFSGCKFTSVLIPNSVSRIGSGAFSCCSSLPSITIPNSVTSLEDAVFSKCSGLSYITIPTSVTNIGYGAFGGCTGLTSITIPNTVTSISNYAFYGCI